MKIGISLPPNTNSLELFFEWVKRVDAGPFSTLSVLDRLVYPNFEPLVTLAAAAAITTRVRLMTEILIAPIRPTALLAKECATLDVLSRGRLSLGVGLGGREEDYIATDMPYKYRGKRLDEQLEQMKRIWSGQSLNTDMGPIKPSPVQTGGPELLVGGLTPRAIQRAARYADGFITARNDLAEINQTLRSLESAWQEAGREGKPRLVAQIDIALDTNGGEQGRQHVRDYYSYIPAFAQYKASTLLTTEQQLSDVIHALEQSGTDEVVFFTWNTNIEQIDRIANVIR
jgi:alkanesulfonate monooxygenase SsuD/methylene tetrahydromethanopterin reductase-like flavin-dependent oxidoreductase (luciferase family)